MEAFGQNLDSGYGVDGFAAEASRRRRHSNSLSADRSLERWLE